MSDEQEKEIEQLRRALIAARNSRRRNYQVARRWRRIAGYLVQLLDKERKWKLSTLAKRFKKNATRYFKTSRRHKNN